VAALGGFLFGFDSGVVNGTVDALAHAFGTRAATTGFAVASVLLGCAVGAFVSGTIADRYGRRPNDAAERALFLLSAVATGLAGSAGVFIASRLVGGLAIGAPACWRPMYISEVAPAHVRGRWPRCKQMAIVLGLFCAFLSNDILARSPAEPARPSGWARRLALDVLDGGRAVRRISAGCLLIPSRRASSSPRQAARARRVFARIGGDADALVRRSSRACGRAPAAPVGLDRSGVGSPRSSGSE
jgi:MFS family permease